MLMSERQNKDTARGIALRGGPSKVALLLPGAECVDIERGVELGVFDWKTAGVLVERNPARFKAMAKKVPRVWPGQSPKVIKSELHRVVPLDHTDYAFLDYYGNVRPADAVWIRDVLAPRLTQNARLHLTITKNTRGNEFVNSIIRDVSERCPDAWRAAIDRQYSARIPQGFSGLLAAYQLFFDTVVFENFQFEYGVHAYSDEDAANMMLVSIVGRKRRTVPLLPEMAEVKEFIESLMVSL